MKKRHALPPDEHRALIGALFSQCTEQRLRISFLNV